MLLEKSSRNPLIDSESDIFYQLASSSFIFFLSFLNSLEEELDKAFQRVLVHVIDDAERNTQEI